MDFLSPDRMNRTELIRIIVCQFALVSAVALFAAFFGLNAGLSAAVGGLCVAVPNTLVVVNLLVWQRLEKAVAADGDIGCGVSENPCYVRTFCARSKTVCGVELAGNAFRNNCRRRQYVSAASF